MKKLISLLTIAIALTANSMELSSFEKIECANKESTLVHTIWPVTYGSNKKYFIVTGYYVAGSLTEEIENGGVMQYAKLEYPNLGYEISKEIQDRGETVLLLNAPGQFFKNNQNLILRTKDMKTGVLEKGQLEGSSENFVQAWYKQTTLNCQFIKRK